MELNSGVFPLYNQIESEVSELFDYTLQQKDQISAIIETHIFKTENELKAPKTFSYQKIQVIQENLNEIRLTNNRIENVLLKIHNLKSLLLFVRNSTDENRKKGFNYLDQLNIEKNKLISLALGQLKLIKREYSELSSNLNQLVLKLWLDREVAAFLKLYLININGMVNHFFQLADKAEVAMADLFTITVADIEISEKDEHLRVVVRMLKNWFKTESELKLIQELFPETVTNV